jgi:hypothetical protein
VRRSLDAFACILDAYVSDENGNRAGYTKADNQAVTGTRNRGISEFQSSVNGGYISFIITPKGGANIQGATARFSSFPLRLVVKGLSMEALFKATNSTGQDVNVPDMLGSIPEYRCPIHLNTTQFPAPWNPPVSCPNCLPPVGDAASIPNEWGMGYGQVVLSASAAAGASSINITAEHVTDWMSEPDRAITITDTPFDRSDTVRIRAYNSDGSVRNFFENSPSYSTPQGSDSSGSQTDRRFFSVDDPITWGKILRNLSRSGVSAVNKGLFPDPAYSALVSNRQIRIIDYSNLSINSNGSLSTGSPTTPRAMESMRDSIRNNRLGVLTGGSGSAYTLTPRVSIPSSVGYHNGQTFDVQFHITNTANPTINIDGRGAISLRNDVGGALAANAIPANSNGVVTVQRATPTATATAVVVLTSAHNNLDYAFDSLVACWVHGTNTPNSTYPNNNSIGLTRRRLSDVRIGNDTPGDNTWDDSDSLYIVLKKIHGRIREESTNITNLINNRQYRIQPPASLPNGGVGQTTPSLDSPTVNAASNLVTLRPRIIPGPRRYIMTTTNPSEGSPEARWTPPQGTNATVREVTSVFAGLPAAQRPVRFRFNHRGVEVNVTMQPWTGGNVGLNDAENLASNVNVLNGSASAVSPSTNGGWYRVFLRTTTSPVSPANKIELIVVGYLRNAMTITTTGSASMWSDVGIRWRGDSNSLFGPNNPGSWGNDGNTALIGVAPNQSMYSWNPQTRNDQENPPNPNPIYDEELNAMIGWGERFTIDTSNESWSMKLTFHRSRDTAGIITGNLQRWNANIRLMDQSSSFGAANDNTVLQTGGGHYSTELVRTYTRANQEVFEAARQRLEQSLSIEENVSVSAFGLSM